MKDPVRYLSLFPVVLLLAVAGCATRPAAPAAKPTATAVSTDGGWLRTELSFFLGDWTETALNTEAESRWQDFLDREVTPRFPEGVSVVESYGQARGTESGMPIRRERGRVLVIVHSDTTDATARLDAIREAWGKLPGGRPVLRTSVPVQVAR